MENKLSIEKISLPLIKDNRGFLVFAESEKHIPFKIKRVFYIGGVEKDGCRGFHANKKNKNILFCIQGSAVIKFDNGKEKVEIFLNEPNMGVLINNKIWHSMENFSKDLIMLVFSSEFYDESDYIRDYKEYIKYIK